MAGAIRPLSGGAITGTGVLSLDSFMFGGLDLNCDGSNAGVVVIRDESSTGDILIDTSSISGKTIIAPFHAPSGKIYYDISGTGADATLYEWIE